MCRADSTRWVLRNFATPPPVPPHYHEDEDEEAENQAFRLGVADRLHLRFPDMDIDWLARIPHDIGLLEVLSVDLSLALGIRAP